MDGDGMLSTIFQLTVCGDYEVVEFQGGLRFRLTGFQRAADASTLKWALQDARPIPEVIDVTSPIDGRKLPKISSTTFDPDSGSYRIGTEDGNSLELTADEAMTMLRPDIL